MAVPLVPRLTSSVPTIPARERVRMVADVLPSYTLLEAVIEGVSVLPVMSAVVVAEVDDNT